MKVRVRFWSYFRDLAGAEALEVTVVSGATVGDLLGEVHRRCPALAPLRGSTLVAVGVEYAAPDRALVDGDEVSLFPPVQGG